MKIPKSAYNWLSAIGFILSLNSLLIMIILFIISLTVESSNTYLGIFIYIVLPVILVLGLILIPIGMITSRKKARLTETGQKWPVFDFNNKKTQRSIIIVSVFTIVFLVISAMAEVVFTFGTGEGFEGFGDCLDERVYGSGRGFS